MATRSSLTTPLQTALRDLDQTALKALAEAEPTSDHDAVLTLLTVHDLHLAPIGDVGEQARFQHHPEIAALKWRLEQRFLDRLAALDDRDGPRLTTEPIDAVAALRAIAHVDAIPPVYDWLAEEADEDDVRRYLSLEGGPDGGFDDLVAVCQVGLDGEAKVELARNYWDEMGRGSLARVHTELHRKLTRAFGLRPPAREDLPLEALERTALGSLLATNRWLQPEAVGALGLIELQAGPRCRRIVQCLNRLGASDDAIEFYAEHAEADPRHGKGWLDNVIATLQADETWAEGMIRGARWRSTVNGRFFRAADPRPAGVRPAAAA